MLDLSPDIPTPFADLAVLASRLEAPLVVFDDHDRCRYASIGMRQVYEFCDFSQPMDFEALLRRSWEHGTGLEESVPADPESHLAFARERRKRTRLEFTRTHPRRLICSHVRLGSGWSAQLRVEPERAGLEHYFLPDVPVTGVMEAIRRREEAERCANALNSVALGVVVTAPDGRLLHTNAAAQALIARADGIAVIDGRLTAADPTMATAFTRALAAAAMGHITEGRLLLHIRGNRPGMPHAVSITQGADVPGVAAIVAVSSPRLDDLAVSRMLRDQFGLTATEAALALEIGAGQTNEEASKTLGKSAATGREQLQSIFRKLNRQDILVSGQLALSRWVSVLASITGAARPRGK